jgi:hypothetical protein
LKLDKADGLVNRAAVSSAVAAATASLADHVHCAGVPCGQLTTAQWTIGWRCFAVDPAQHIYRGVVAEEQRVVALVR